MLNEFKGQLRKMEEQIAELKSRHTNPSRLTNSNSFDSHLNLPNEETQVRPKVDQNVQTQLVSKEKTMRRPRLANSESQTDSMINMMTTIPIIDQSPERDTIFKRDASVSASIGNDKSPDPISRS